MILSTLFMVFISTASAGPTGHEVQVDMTNITSEDARWDMVGGGTIALGGVRGGWRVASNTNITAGWRRGIGSNTFASGDTAIIDGDEEYSEIDVSGPQLGIVVDQFSLGAKYSWPAKHWIQPYGAGDVVLTMGQLELDDDPDKEGNPNEFSRSALAPGGTLTAGVEFLPFNKDSRLRISIFIEAGYHFSFPLEFVDDTQKEDILIGDLPIGGLLNRVGVGARF